MNGAHALLSTLVANGVTTCFANPGTSEMHFVAGLDDVPEIRGILCLFEGVATGAADGYARVRATPAAALVHLGPGLANGWANLHNARRARVPVVTIVGDHATYHARYDAALQSDLASLVTSLQGWHRRTVHANDVATDTADAIATSFGPPGQLATLILPADASWGTLDTTPATWPRVSRPAPVAINESALARAREVLRTKRSAILLGGAGVRRDELALAHRVATASGARVLMETFPAIMDRGRGVASPERLIYLSEFAISQLSEIEALVLVGATTPVGFFAYPDVASELVATGCEVVNLAPPGADVAAALRELIDATNAPASMITDGTRPDEPSGALTTQNLALCVGATMPEDLIVSDESNTGGVHLFGATQFSPEHQWMTLTGGSIGFGLPVALGAAVASGQRVLAIEADGSMMYTPQALWTMAREGLDVTVLALSNRSYAILNLERQRLGAVTNGATSQRMLDLDNPTLDLCSIATGLGVPSTRVTTAEELVTALKRSYATPGPTFIEAVLPKGLG